MQLYVISGLITEGKGMADNKNHQLNYTRISSIYFYINTLSNAN